MLYDFVTLYRDDIIGRARAKVTDRPWPLASTSELEHGVPLFLTQLAETLRLEESATPFSSTAIAASAARHGRELLEMGFNVSQVVHDYGDICQAITELAVEQRAPITTDEFQILHRLLDAAIAGAVSEHARVSAEAYASQEVERTGQLSHEIRDILNTALLAYDTLKRGTVAITGSTGAILGRSLIGLRELVENSLSDVRMAANHQRRERIQVTAFVNDIATAAGLHGDAAGLHFTVDGVDPGLAIDVDPQILSSAVMHLLNNAFKCTRPGGRVVLRAHKENDRLLIEVEDECGGTPERPGDPFQPLADQGGRHQDQRGGNQMGAGLGLTTARKAVRVHGGDISVRNTLGQGCIVVIDIPLVDGTSTAPNLVT
jgi:signal transduction histidine kinase